MNAWTTQRKRVNQPGESDVHPKTPAKTKPGPALIVASLLLALSLACTGDSPPATPTPTPAPVDIDAAIAEAVATAVAAALAGAAADPAADAAPDGRQEDIAQINADAAALSQAVGIALDQLYNGRFRGDIEGAIAHAVSVTNADPDAVAVAVGEALRTLPPPPAPLAASALDDALSAAVTLALQDIIDNPHDESGAIARAASMTNADAGALAAAVNQVLNDPFSFSNIDVDTAIAASNAVAEPRALAAARAAADAAEAARQAAADASAAQTATATAVITPTPVPAPTPVPRYEAWNNHEWLAEPKPWWRDSNPYNCDPPSNPNSPWTAAGLPDLGGQDPLSLIRWFGNGSYVRYGLMGFEGCTFMKRHPERTHLDIPADPAYYSVGVLEIAVDIARVPASAPDWPYDNGARVDMSMDEAVDALNTHVAAYFRKISQDKLQMTFVAGHEFQAGGQGTPQEVEDQWLTLIGIVGCDPDDPDRAGCRWGMPGALNRFLLNDVKSSSGGSAWNGYADFGLVSLQHATMTTLVHEIGHGWMFWPHSYTELPWKPDANGPYKRPNFYSNPHDFMSELTFARPAGWHQDMPATLAVNRYAAGWIAPEDVALHLSDETTTYTLARPRKSGHQFLVIHSGRPGAFTTIEVLDERNAVYRDTNAVVYDPASPAGRRPIRYDGVMVSRYDQTTGTGINARVGPALYNAANPGYETDVGFGRDDFSVIPGGESRSIGGGLTVSVSKNLDGSYDVTVSGGKTAAYEPWCIPIWFSQEYDTGCMLEDFDF